MRRGEKRGKKINQRRGLYRTFDSYVGECARVDESAGDAAPWLRRELYEALGFEPAFDTLPFKAMVLDRPDRLAG